MNPLIKQSITLPAIYWFNRLCVYYYDVKLGILPKKGALVRQYLMMLIASR
mgnify:CR=1 FL=1